MSNKVWAVRLVAGLAFVVLVYAGALARAEDVGPISVTVSGEQINLQDLKSLVKGVFAARPKQLPEEPSAMPSDAPLIYYAGNGTIWESTKVRQNLGGWARVSPAEQPGEDAFVAAVALAAMDAGTAGKPWDDLYRRTPSDPVSRLALGLQVAEAMKLASDQSSAFAAEQTAWMQSHILPGMTRSDAYALLKTRNLVAFNGTYAERRLVGGWCDPDPNGGTWPYANEAVPKQPDACAIPGVATKQVPNPDALVKIAAAFGLGCEQAILTTMSFGLDDRVGKVVVGKPDDRCV